jgi:hypothetical protein
MKNASGNWVGNSRLEVVTLLEAGVTFCCVYFVHVQIVSQHSHPNPIINDLDKNEGQLYLAYPSHHNEHGMMMMSQSIEWQSINCSIHPSIKLCSASAASAWKYQYHTHLLNFLSLPQISKEKSFLSFVL